MLTTTPTFQVLADAIESSALRQAVYSANVANASVEGYQRLEVAFDAQLAAVERELASGAEPRMTTRALQVVSTQQSVKLDEEMARMAQNALQYQTLVSMFEKEVSLLRLAIKEGRE